MATLAPRIRDQPDIRARISIHDESTDDIKNQLQLADQRQRALLRSQQSWQSSDTNGPLQRAVLRKTRTVPGRPGHLNDDPISDALPCPLRRSNSLNSLSTLHREADAAALSLYRGSPISAISPPCVGPMWKPSLDYEPQDPCPPRPPARVETLSDHRRYQKLLKKSMKRDRKTEKEQAKAQKQDEQMRREFLAAEVAAARKRNEHTLAQSLPVRSKSTKSIASQLAKTFSLGKLSRQRKNDKTDPPRLTDFDSKDELRDYINPAQPVSDKEIAELPAELPQYTPFQDSTRTQHNEPVVLLEDNPAPRDKEDGLVSKDNELDPRPSTSNSRSMRCDHCQNPIRLNQLYYHCSICEDGDRMLCSSCDQAGWSCRHDITEKVRSVSRTTQPRKAEAVSIEREPNISEQRQHAAAIGEPNMPTHPAETCRSADTHHPTTMSAGSPRAYNDASTRLPPKHHQAPSSSSRPNHERNMEVWRREQDVAIREKEIVLRKREATMRERQASLREQEAALNVRTHLFALELQSALAKQARETSIGVGAQFQDLSQDSHIRSHGNKRKAGGSQTGLSPANSTTSGQRSPLKRSPSDGHGQDASDDDKEDNESGIPKKLKHEPDAIESPEKLFACPYCKHDKARYSERNVHEKHYRGCASGYWPDISRLKQHLYRVHWRRLHCVRCYAKFDRKELLDQHVRGSQPCALVDCPYPEKFDDGQYNDIRRKRPANTPEQVWYIIYGTLFPGQAQPSSPYADHLNAPTASLQSPCGPEQDAMDVLGEVFESRLDQCVGSSAQAWLQSPAAREFIRQQLRSSMTDVLERIKPVTSPSVGNPSVEVSPYSAVPSDATRRASISLTPVTSVPPSPINGNSDAQFLLPSHRQSFSRPFPSRTLDHVMSAQPMQPRTDQHAREACRPSTNITFPISPVGDPENDQYDEECHSWTQGDERGLAISGDFNFDFNSELGSATPNLNQATAAPCEPPRYSFHPVRLDSLEPSSVQSVSRLKANHSNASSVDSGYGSFHKSSSTSSAPTASGSAGAGTRLINRPVRGKMKGKNIAQDGRDGRDGRDSSPVPESAINFDALDVPFEEFLAGALESGMDEFGNVGHNNLSEYHLRYPAF
ncbi:hypothetical protein LTR72_005859 [Exophiala xenobiotica]|nr:hypothetical protein LTR72_005859 [Exophiala xenobiotica]KAK5297158.1 hypothetical protein LTR14_002889 [Exophiala xenobiotica]KAK5437218.1 hypothetical protein LTR18_009080 [Exophiala xenobiotica]KAK5486023.1 hypothetical protein LTR55_005701 [Exophiala xenobiotica]KAK5554852.1 hypothetical protein LTR46_007056 [Exophiala xenobiotica]